MTIKVSRLTNEQLTDYVKSNGIVRYVVEYKTRSYYEGWPKTHKHRKEFVSIDKLNKWLENCGLDSDEIHSVNVSKCIYYHLDVEPIIKTTKKTLGYKIPNEREDNEDS